MPRERTIGISLPPHVEEVLRARASVEGRRIASLAALAVESWIATTPVGTLPVPLPFEAGAATVPVWEELRKFSGKGRGALAANQPRYSSNKVFGEKLGENSPPSPPKPRSRNRVSRTVALANPEAEAIGPEGWQEAAQKKAAAERRWKKTGASRVRRGRKQLEVS